ncbi:hypothetical protein ACTFYA_25240, partial [Escherichia coli]|uniref:hypothetical protein n=1 Tax=Escherichia coli TaxID=562 RepID=UPI003F766F7B
VPAYGPQNDVTLKMPAFEWVHVQLHQQKGMISLSPPTICNSALPEPWQLRRFGDYRAKVANDVNDVILRRLPYPASHRTDMRQKSNAG